MEKTQIKNATIINVDCMEYMKTLPDKFFDLAIVDPPYGIGDKLLNGGKTGAVKFHEQYELKKWDNYRPDAKYWFELFRVSHNQIVWGGNYFSDFLPPSRGIISWDKNLGEPNNFSHFELAWTSFDCIARKVVVGSNTGNRIHPTQKPVKLYEWILTKYAKPGQTIFDSHMGSGSSAIAAINLGFEYVGCELDKDYYAAACKRIEQHAKQERLF